MEEMIIIGVKNVLMIVSSQSPNVVRNVSR